MRIGRPRYADVAATIALVVALGGTAYAATTLPKRSVGAKQLQMGAVIHAKIAKGAVGNNNLKPGSVGLNNLEGMNAPTTLSLSINANTCSRVLIDTDGAKGGKAGQGAFLAFTGTTDNPIPVGLTMSPLQLDDGTAAEAVFCNVSGTTITLTDQPIRMISFGG